jgi:LysM repeat protein
MVVAFLVLAIARTSSPSSPSTPTPAASSSAVAGVSASPTVGPSLTPAGSSPSPAAPSPIATSSPGASAAAGTTYKVKRRDTLGSIALKFGVTVKALRKANGLTKSSVIRPGQVLVIPVP